MSKHTPGPWKWNGDNQLWGGENEGTEVLMAGDDGRPWGGQSGVIEHHWDKEVAQANANLIASSPDLLAALGAVKKAIDDSGHFWINDLSKGGFDIESIDAAIKKAKGE